MTAALGNTGARRCRICGCTDKQPCVTGDPLGFTCAWSSHDEGLCDFCVSAMAAMAQWLALQAENARGFEVEASRRLLAEAVKVAHAFIDEDDEAAPRVALVSEAEGAAYLRAKGAGV